MKTNNKKARENIRKYIIANFTPEDYTDNPPGGFAVFLILVIFITVPPLMTSAQFLKKQKKKKHAIQKNKPKTH